MQITTSRTISPQANTSFLQSDFSKITRSLEKTSHSVSLHPFINFQGQISVGEFLSPIQQFSLTEKNNYVFIENFPINSLPSIKIVLDKKKSKVEVNDFKVERSDNSVQGELLYTRLFLMLSEIKKCSFDIRNIGLPPFNFSFAELSEEERTNMLRRAKLARKLRFLELFFKTTFNLPENFDANDLRQIEILFRGITEGEFSIPVDRSITVFNYKTSKEDLQNISVSSKREFSFELNEDLLVLGKLFSVGKMIFKIKKGSIANPRVLINLRKGETIPELRLNIFDYQIHHCFEKYKNSERLLKNKQNLERFKNDLRKEESEFLIDLLDESLAQEITDKIAIEIVTGWMQFYDFPDRYTVGEPVLEKNQWRVPIWLTYPNDKGVWLEDAFVNFRTGNIEISSSAKALREKGKSKAKEIFSVV